MSRRADRGKYAELAAVNMERLLLAAVVLGLWQLLSGRAMSRDLISDPATIGSIIGHWILTPVFWKDALVTFGEAAGGLIIGTLLGAGVGIALGVNRFLGEVFSPIITGLYTIPKIALMPLFFIFFGIGLQSKLILVIVIVFFFVFYDTVHGLRSVKADLLDCVRLMGASRMQMFLAVQWPFAKQWVLDGMRIACPLAFGGAVSGEILLSQEGLGFLVRQGSQNFDTGQLMAALVVLAVLAACVSVGVGAVGSRSGRTAGQMSI